MPVIESNGCPIHVEVEGPESAPVLILSNSLGTTLHMWDGQVGAVHQAFPAGALRPPRPRQIRPAQGPLFHGDARPRRARDHGRARHQEGELVRALDGRHGRHVARRQCAGALRAAWCLSNTSSYFADKKGWNDRLALVRDKGVPAFAAPNMERWFTKGFRERDPQAIARMHDDVRGDAARRLHRLRRSRARHGPPRSAAADQSADAGHHRAPRSRHRSGSRRIHLQQLFRAPNIS